MNLLEQPSQLLNDLQRMLRGDEFWDAYLEQLRTPNSLPYALHLAVFVEPYLQYVIEGKKTVESRFSANRCAPYYRVGQGDVLLLKRSGGPVVGICQVSEVWFYRLDPDSWDEIKTEYAHALCAQNPQFWQDRATASFATLMRIQHVRSVAPFNYPKRDRRGWVVLQEKGCFESLQQTLIGL